MTDGTDSNSVTANAASTVVMSESQLQAAAVHQGRTPAVDFDQSLEDYQDLLLISSFRIRLGYKMQERLGSGRQGVVVQVERRAEPECLTHHALKVFTPALYDTVEEYNADMLRIARQVGVLQTLHHPNLVQCGWMYRMKGIGMLLMELVYGIDLFALTDHDQHGQLKSVVEPEEWEYVNSVVFNEERHAVQPGVAFYILRKILRGLEVLHRFGYIHCDIKPSNIMIDRFGTVKLIDFGRAVSVHDDSKGNFLASPMYVAPEGHRRERITQRADLFSAGMVTAELLHGGFLIDPNSTEEELLEFKMTLAERLEELLPERLTSNETLMTILRRLVAANPADRYVSASDADAGAEGVRVLHQELALARLDADYGRELERYIEMRLAAAGRTDGRGGNPVFGGDLLHGK